MSTGVMRVIPFLLDHLITANLYMGFNSTFRHVSMKMYISYVKASVDIINLAMTLYNLRLVLSFISKIYFSRGLLMVNLYEEHMVQQTFFGKNAFLRLFKYKSLFHKKFTLSKDKRLRFLFFKWVNGLIGNYRKIKKHNLNLPREFITHMSFPSVVFFLSYNLVQRQKIPVINVVDTSSNIRKALYW